jgi:1-acyl-sn-glycerol-3-phosphate acyltransferase
MSQPADTPRPAPPDLTVGWTQRAATAIATQFAYLYYGLEVHGLDHLPPTESCLVCANHTSHVDTFALACATGRDSRRLVFLAARDYFFTHRWRSWLIRRLICLVPFERTGGMAAAKHNLRMFAACRDERRVVVLYPEGTRSRDGRISEFKPGVAMFAEKLGLRVIPCRIEGSFESLPKGRRLPRPRPLRLTFGPALALAPRPEHETGADRAARYGRFAAELQAAVAALGAPAGGRIAVVSA